MDKKHDSSQHHENDYLGYISNKAITCQLSINGKILKISINV